MCGCCGHGRNCTQGLLTEHPTVFSKHTCRLGAVGTPSISDCTPTQCQALLVTAHHCQLLSRLLPTRPPGRIQ